MGVLVFRPTKTRFGRSLNVSLTGHRNVKAFVSHGGMNSFQESIFHRVPIVTIPIFGDQVGIKKSPVRQLKNTLLQIDSAMRIEEKGFGPKRIDHNNFDALELASKIDDAINNET